MWFTEKLSEAPGGFINLLQHTQRTLSNIGFAKRRDPIFSASGFTRDLYHSFTETSIYSCGIASKSLH